MKQHAALLAILSEALENFNEVGSDSLVEEQARRELGKLGSSETGELFISTAYLISACAALRDQLWILNQRDGKSQNRFDQYLIKIFQAELSALSFILPLIMGSDSDQFLRIIRILKRFQREIVVWSKGLSVDLRREFLERAFASIRSLITGSFVDNSDKIMSNSWDRAFDMVDDIFQLDYNLENGPALSQVERIYQGAGVGVQSSYAVIIKILEQVRPKPGARVLDLGSGYGRLGLAIGFLRPDIEFLGYEFVGQRVATAQAAAERAGLENKIKFTCQDLSALDFEIPVADYYYMYDPFSRETYSRVIQGLNQIAKLKPVTIITKGYAKAPLLEGPGAGLWIQSDEFDNGTLSLFHSAPIF